MTQLQKEMLAMCPNGTFQKRDIPKKYQNCLIGFAPRWGLFDIEQCNDPCAIGKKGVRHFQLNNKGIDVKKQILMEVRL